MLWSWFDLPDDPRSHGLSAAAWDAKARALFTVQDRHGTIVELRPDAALASWSFGATLALDLPFELDAEGLVALADGFVIASEAGPRVVEVDRRGRLRREIPLPASLARGGPTRASSRSP